MQDNIPDLWRIKFPAVKPDHHKYNRGLAVIYAAPQLTGATRLAAMACARIGAGLVNVLAPKAMVPVYQTSLPPHILVRGDLNWWDERCTARLYGPGGLAKKYHYDPAVKTVLDADALNDLPKTLGPNFVLTPHEGEFARAFPQVTGNRAERAVEAARQTGAVIVLKGAETVIADAAGRCVINKHAGPNLATAGTGDVLAGMITGLLAQGMEPFDAACAGVWMHGDGALRFGPGLVATDLIDQIPAVLKEVLGKSG